MFKFSAPLAVAVLAMLAPGALAAQTVGPPAPTDRPVTIASGPGEVSREAPVNGVLTLFGNQRCPTNSDGEEIVVCQRLNAGEQFRVPKELREGLVITPENEAWAAKAQSTLDAGVGVNGIGSCSTVGAGGATGCFAQRVRESRRENSARAASTPVLP